METAHVFFERYNVEIGREVVDLTSLRAWAANHESDLDANPAAWCAIELALLDALAREEELTIDQFLSLPPLTGRFRYTAVLGDQDGDTFRATADQYRRFGFQDFKVKLSGDPRRDRDKIAVVREWGEPVRVRADANNLWDSSEAAVAFLRDLAYPFFAIEEPFHIFREKIGHGFAGIDIRQRFFPDVILECGVGDRPIAVEDKIHVMCQYPSLLYFRPEKVRPVCIAVGIIFIGDFLN
jgi:hypothetical protein